MNKLEETCCRMMYALIYRAVENESYTSLIVESPIETMMYCSLRVAFPDAVVDCPHHPREGDAMPQHVLMESQKQIGSHRVDFVVSCHWSDMINAQGKCPHKSHSVIVECDGHDYHERTKEQARRDKSRDRELVMLGYTVLRFAGSEIYADPWACGREVFKALHGYDGGSHINEYLTESSTHHLIDIAIKNRGKLRQGK